MIDALVETVVDGEWYHESLSRFFSTWDPTDVSVQAEQVADFIARNRVVPIYAGIALRNIGTGVAISATVTWLLASSARFFKAGDRRSSDECEDVADQLSRGRDTPNT